MPQAGAVQGSVSMCKVEMANLSAVAMNVNYRNAAYRWKTNLQSTVVQLVEGVLAIVLVYTGYYCVNFNFTTYKP
jgi:hypothetical protein